MTADVQPGNQETIPQVPVDLRALVAIDLGAESCRVSLLRWVDKKPTINLVYRFASYAEASNGELRWPMRSILQQLMKGLQMCAEIAIEGIRSIAVDGWAVDYVRLNEAGEAIAEPFCYRDERTIAAEIALHERLSPARMRELTGLQLLRINTVYQHRADPPNLRACRWLNLPEYVLYTLGARPVAELTNATHSQMVGLDGRWSSEIFAALDESLLQAPEIVPPGTDVGVLRGELTKLPAFAATRLIAPACHDTASAIAAIPDTGDDWAYISSGTWSLVGTVLSAPLNTKEASAQNFTNLGGVDGTVCFHKNVNGMWLLRQCMESWETPLSIAELLAAAKEFGPREYVLAVDDPDLLLQGQMPERINAQLRRRGLSEIAGDADHAAKMTSFLLYSLAARYAEVLHSVAAISGKRLRRLYIMGGGSQNALLNRLTAEATCLDVHCAGTECSTLGNFAVQLATLEGQQGARAAASRRWAGLLSCCTKPQGDTNASL